MKEGIYLNLPNEDYHASEGVSKSGLWTIQTKSPAHYRYEDREHKAAFDIGTAAHLAILEPNDFESKVHRGPDDRRGNKWKDAAEFCATEGMLILTSGDYDNVLACRDAVHADAWINSVITGGKPMIEASGFKIDEATGALVRVRPDFYREDLGIILDLKTTRSAHPDAFARSVVDYGYHAQEAIYSDVWGGLGKPVEGFVFLAAELKTPYVHAAYELPPSMVEEGRTMMRQALDTYTACRATDSWPAYGDGVQELSFKRWAYRHTDAPDAIDEQAAA